MPDSRAFRAGRRLLAALIIAASWNAGAAPESRARFDQWQAVCLPDGSCSATALAGAAQLRVSRARADAPWALAWMPAALLGPGGRLSIRVDDAAPLDLAPAAGFRLLSDGRGAAVTDRAATRRLLAAMKKGREAEFAYRTAGGAASRERFSLAGLTAALNFIAERQPPIR